MTDATEVASATMDEPTVTESALVKRITRHLRWECGAELRKHRGGTYYISDRVGEDILDGEHVDPETLGRELHVLAPWEEVERAT